METVTKILIKMCPLSIDRAILILVFLAFDLNLWPATLAYNRNIAKVKVNLHTKKSRS